MSEETQDSQKEAQKDNEIPAEVKLNEPTPVDEYTKENEQVKDKLAVFGATDLEQFLAKVTSNPIYGKLVLRNLLGLDGDKPFVDVEHKTSPQENGVTGRLDHSTYPPKIKGGVTGEAKEAASVEG